MLLLSDAQARILDAWKRPPEVHERVTMVPENPLDLAQDAITDCSIVASMCAAVSREERGHSKVSMFPLTLIRIVSHAALYPARLSPISYTHRSRTVAQSSAGMESMW